MHAENRINLDDQAEVMLWADNLSISVDRLREIVARVGPMVPAVTFYAKKSGAETNRGTFAARHARNDASAPRQNATAGPVTPPTVFPSITT